ncbi:MAG: transcriptional repressor [Lachnospiraceae bacterium]|nr:transcriptional repressor [Lachnospiraceae bacterium]
MANLKYSKQRETIKEYLRSTTEHPTADMVYDKVRETFPNISLGTVYRNLSLLEEIGEIIKISTGVGPDHYDYNTAPHYHFICRGCGHVMDIDLDFADELMTQVQESTDLAIESCSVLFTGLCPDCENELS